jgi:hypothetical protein
MFEKKKKKMKNILPVPLERLPMGLQFWLSQPRVA